MNGPDISVIVPCFNAERYLGTCLESLAAQKLPEIEMIFIDDGSTDGTGAILDRFRQAEPRAKVFHKKNGGLSDTRNFGIKKSTGEIIAFVDSDDYVKGTFVFKMLEEMDKIGADIAVCGYNNIAPRKETLSGAEATSRLLVRQDNVDILAWNKLYKKELFTDNGIEFPKWQNHEDLLTTYKVMSKAKKVVFVDESLYNYVERGGSITKEEKVEERLIKREQAAKEAIGIKNY